MRRQVGDRIDTSGQAGGIELMSDVVVTVPKTFEFAGQRGLAAWVAEGCLPGDPCDGTGYLFSTWGPRPSISRGERVYVVCEGFIRGFAPLVELRGGYGHRNGGRLTFVRAAGAQAVTLRGPDRKPAPVVGFRGWRYRWWELADEMPFPKWQSYGTVEDARKQGIEASAADGQMMLF